MLKKVKGFVVALHNNERGGYFLEMALTLIGVGLAIYGAASGLSNNGIKPKYDSITTEVSGVSVPDLTP
ncbi:MAG: hypothetical protein ACOY30_10990 [Bacillota bacterium]